MNVVFDLDGTICFDGQQIDQNLTRFLDERINQVRNHQLIFASARPVRDILSLLPEELHHCYLIGGNGTMMYYQKEVKWLKVIEPFAATFIIDYIQRQNLDYLIDEAWDYSFKGDSLQTLRKKVDVLQVAKNLPIETITRPVKILISNYQNEAQLISKLNKLAVDCIIYPSENCIDVIDQGVNKASALRAIIGDADYLAFGNDRNDLEMLQGASYSVCVGDSQEIQGICHQTIQEDTQQVIQVLEEYV